MGAGQSSTGGSIANPFPVDSRLSKDLDKLSIVAARILSTPDIYDVNNLARPGVCGDYAVFLRKNLEKKLLPFVFDDSGKRTEVVYQNPRKSMENQELRKKICRSMIDTMLRTISTVVACLASIQVASPSRETAIIGIGAQKGGQRGGGIPEIRDWLAIAGYIDKENKSAAGTAIPFRNPGLPQSNDFRYYLTFDRTEQPTTFAFITAKTEPTASASFNPLPTGALRVQFLNPVQIPVPPNVPPQSILPIRLVDNANIPWCAGVLYQNVFKSFNTTSPQFYITDLIIRLFRRTQGSNDEITETRNDINIANNVFQEYRKTMISKYIFDAIPQFLTQHIPGYQSYAPGAIQQPQYIQGPGGILQQVIPSAPTVTQQAVWRPTAGVGAGAGAQQVALRPLTTQVIPGVTDFDIPSSSAKSITDTLKMFRSSVSVESSPAAVRATTLAALENRDRTVQTGICTDKYWTMPNLARVYPWSTLQFLSVRDWSALSEDRSKTQFDPEWERFINNLSSLYNGVGTNPKLERPGDTKFLDQMRITNVSNLAICKQSQTPRVAFQEVQAGIQELQALYRDHVRKMWDILNSLILVIVDPETQQEVVRLHPSVVAGASSEAYVNERAATAREAIAKYYIDVEKVYLKAGGSLRLA